MHLNEDVQLQICESLDLKDLLSVAQTNNHLSAVAAYIFKRKYADKKVRIFDSNKDSLETNNDSGDIEIHGAENILAFLKHFGKSILKLDFVGNTNRKNAMNLTLLSSINKLIGTVCSEYLTEIEVESPHESFLNDMIIPFKRVESVTLRDQFKTLDGPILKFNELFPAMRRLYLPRVAILDKDCVNQTFPQLEHLFVGIVFFHDHIVFTEGDLVRLMKSNPQIRSLKLGRCSEPFLQTISGILPDLEVVELMYYVSNDGSDNAAVISLKNLKVLIVNPGYFHISTNFDFENLIELHTDSYPSANIWWEGFVRKSKSLKKLHLRKGCANDKTLEIITSTGLHLNELSLTVCREVAYENVIKFVQANEQLEQIHFLKFYPDVSLKLLVQALSGKIENEWKITPLSNEVRIERK